VGVHGAPAIDHTIAFAKQIDPYSLQDDVPES
jgi:hypothetical protein